MLGVEVLLQDKDISEEVKKEIKIEVSVKEEKGDNPCPQPVYSAIQKKNTLNHQVTPTKKEFPKPPSHPRHNDYPTKKLKLLIPPYYEEPREAPDYPTSKELKIIRKIQKLEDKLKRIRYGSW